MWVSSIVAKGANKGMTESDVVMVAHKGMCLDHVVLVKTLVMCGLSLPLWRLSDTLPIFEIVIKSGSSAQLSDLVHYYVPWFTHVENDASSDAEALKNVVTLGVRDWDMVCYTFSTLCIDFTKSVGLNTVMPILRTIRSIIAAGTNRYVITFDEMTVLKSPLTRRYMNI